MAIVGAIHDTTYKPRAAEFSSDFNFLTGFLASYAYHDIPSNQCTLELQQRNQLSRAWKALKSRKGSVAQHKNRFAHIRQVLLRTNHFLHTKDTLSRYLFRYSSVSSQNNTIQIQYNNTIVTITIIIVISGTYPYGTILIFPTHVVATWK